MSRIVEQAPPAFRKPPPLAPCYPQVTMRRGVFVAFAGLLVAFGTCAAGSVGYIFWRDEALQALSARHAGIERSYEEQVSALRRELDRVNSQRVIEEAAVDARVRELWNRQAQIEKRATILSALASGGQTSIEPSQKTTGATMRAQPAPQVLTPAALGYAAPAKGPSSSALDALRKATPGAARTESAAPQRPQNSSGERPALRGAFMPSPARRGAAESAAPVGNLASMTAALDRVEQMQIGLAGAVGKRARRQAQKLQALASEIGLSADRIARASTPEGGPFVPLSLDPDGSAFDREMLRHQDDLARADRLRRLLAAAPLGRPVSGAAEQTSGFGSRIDPFLGRPAYHTGLDFRETPGAPVFATAAGKVVLAGSHGGYGLMVEIDHGNGIATRYAHLSAILVEEGQCVEARKPVGRVGSTGRSTGPHLHYEVRIDDEAVNPVRFLRAGASLASAMAAHEP